MAAETQAEQSPVDTYANNSYHCVFLAAWKIVIMPVVYTAALQSSIAANSEELEYAAAFALSAGLATGLAHKERAARYSEPSLTSTTVVNQSEPGRITDDSIIDNTTLELISKPHSCTAGE
jgi:hypothetical protein